MHIANQVIEARMKQNDDGWEWKEISLVNRRLQDIYLIGVDDAGTDDERLTSHWQMKQAPYEFVEWFAIKYHLDPKYVFGL
jgi:hypothetical protein